jgi:hypothetical protein
VRDKRIYIIRHARDRAEMNQCVPSWDLVDDPTAAVAGGGGGLNHQVSTTGGAHRGLLLQASAGGAGGGGAFAPVVVPMSNQYYEVAELTWEKGNISSHGLLNRPAHNKYPPAAAPSSAQLHAIAGGGGRGGGSPSGDRETLEAVVGEAAARSHFLSQPAPPWLIGADAVARAAADALVPCAARAGEAAADGEADASRRKRPRVVGDDSLVVCASQGSTAPRRRGESALLTQLDACGAEADDVCGFTTTTTNNSTSMERDDKGSPDTENTSIGGGASDSRCFSRRSQASS